MTQTKEQVHFARIAPLPRRVRVVIEVPRGSFIKRHPDGAVDFVSPLPCPYNYGSIRGTESPDGDPLDALVLGPRMRLGEEVEEEVRAVIGFIDGGVFDPKVICAPAPLSPGQRRGVERFFATYAVLKRAVHHLRGDPGRTLVSGWLPLESERQRRS